MKTHFIATAILLAGSVAPVHAQSQPPVVPQWQIDAGGKMAFDVASIKRDTSSRSVRPDFPFDAGDTYHATGGLLSADFPVQIYISFAYKLTVTDDQLFLASQLPKWANKDKFDIQARAAGTNPTKDQMRLMMQSLLADRFKLAAHWEKKDMPVYTLVVAPGGFKLKPSDPKNDPLRTADSIGCPDDDPVCARMFPGSVSVSDFAGILGSLIGRPVIDKTGVTGTYDMDIKWAISPGSSLPSLPSALRDQFGLELKSGKASVNVLVIDHVAEPTPN